MDDIIQKLQMLRDETIPLRPIYEPYNEQAKALVDKVHWALNLTDDRPTSVEKQKLVVCGFLAAALVDQAGHWAVEPAVASGLESQR